MITHGPVQWPLTAVCDYTTLGLDPAMVPAVEQSATDWLWEATGGRFGTRTTAWRPQVTPPGPDVHRGADPFSGLAATAGAYAAWPFFGTATCTPPVAHTITLPGPVVEVTAVTVDGAMLPTSAWQLTGDVLRRTDGQTWPTSQDTAQPTSAAGTWQVQYTRGRVVPPLGQRVAGLLACELAKRVTGAKDCKIPANATTVSKNGTVINLEKGALTNVPEVDQWIRLVNPKALRRPGRVWAPELRTVIR